MTDPSPTQRFARQLLLAEIGQAGQARLCATRVRVPDATSPAVAAVAREYLLRAGLSVDLARGERARDGARDNAEPVAHVDLLSVDERACSALAGRVELEAAASALAGAFAAVEAIKGALAIGTSAHLPSSLSLASLSSEVRP